MTATAPRAVFVNAEPVAVFAVLADLKGRDKIINSITRIVLETPSPVRAGSIFRETRKGPLSRSHLIRIETFVPPHTVTFSRRIFGIGIQIALQLEKRAGGTNVLLHATGITSFLPAFIPQHLADRWARQLEQDLEDFRRYVEPRANPTWRPTIAKNGLPPSAKAT